LVGKNNSGKSTVLDAIDALFAVASGEAIVAGDYGRTRGPAALGREPDFRRGVSSGSTAIRISVDFTLAPGELDIIVQGVVSEAPQMRNAIENATACHLLRIEVSSFKHQRPFAYVSKIALLPQGNLQQAEPRSRTLLSVGPDAAKELFSRRQSSYTSERRAEEISQMGQRIGHDDFEMLRRSRDPISRYGRGYLPGGSQEVAYEVDNIVRSVESYTEFRSQLDVLEESARASAQRIDKEPLENPVETFAGESTVIPGYVPSILKLVGKVRVLHLRDRREPVGRGEAQRLLSLKTRRQGSEVLHSIQETVRSLLGVSIDAFENEKLAERTRDARAEMDVDDVLVEMNGAGIREALRLILDNELGSPDLLLVEEPEVHLHPALELTMLRYLKSASSRAQVFVATHSTNFLDTSEMRNVYLTRRDPWVTASLLDSERAEAAIPEELGIRLSSLFMYDRLVFVEGSSDESILRELAAVAGVNLAQTGVGFVIMGSARNFTHYASAATVELLTRRRVEMLFILDRDEASEEEVEALTNRIGGRAKVHVLQRREIENYLALPRPLAAFIRERLLATGTATDDVTENLISERLSSCADDLQHLALRKRVVRTVCSPVYFERGSLAEKGEDAFAEELTAEMEKKIAALRDRVSNIPDRISQERENIASAWNTSKLHIVPGDELLDAVCRSFGIRFRKRRDGARLAHLLERHELPGEVVELLNGLVA
jgi:energy-coupling factor transporter ATP-binding protein EcfA2